ncbi:MAG: hypothetical protein ACK5IJ_03335 [Mangrovibacterium sp.]
MLVKAVENNIQEWNTQHACYRDILDSSYVIATKFPSLDQPIIDNAFDSYTPKQVMIIKQILNIAKNSSLLNFQENIQIVEELIYKLPKEEQLELLVMNEMIKGACDAMVDLKLNDNRYQQKSFATFVCNLTSGGIGTVYGAWAGAIAGAAFGASTIVSGGTAAVVSLVVGSAISTIAC